MKVSLISCMIIYVLKVDSMVPCDRSTRLYIRLEIYRTTIKSDGDTVRVRVIPFYFMR